MAVVKLTPEEIQVVREQKDKYEALINAAKERGDETEVMRVSFQWYREYNDYMDECAQKHFDAIAKDPAAILENAREITAATLEMFRHDLENMNTIADLKEDGGITIEGEKELISSKYAAEFILHDLDLHIAAFSNDRQRQKELFDMVLNAVKQCEYTDNSEIVLTLPEMDVPAHSPYRATPIGPFMPFMARASSNVRKSKSGDVRRLTQSPNNRHEKIEMGVEERKGANGKSVKVLVIKMSNKQSGSEFCLEFKEIQKLFGKGNKSFFRLFVYCLQEINAQSFRPDIFINLRDMVSLGMYSTVGNALDGINRFYDQQKCMEISGTFKKWKEVIKAGRGQLFYNIEYDRNGGVTLSLNKNLNVQFFASFFTILPEFAYNLDSNGFLLTWYIFYIARQRTKEIKDNGCFTIRLDTIRDILGLPRVEEVKRRKYKQFIKDPITDAIKDIMTGWEEAEKGEGDDLKIVLNETDSTNINEWLQGRIEVQLSGSLSEKFIKISQDAEEKRAKLEKAKLEAIAKADAKKKK